MRSKLTTKCAERLDKPIRRVGAFLTKHGPLNCQKQGRLKRRRLVGWLPFIIDRKVGGDRVLSTDRPLPPINFATSSEGRP